MKRQLNESSKRPHKRQRTETATASKSWDEPLFGSNSNSASWDRPLFDLDGEEKESELGDSDSDCMSLDEEEGIRTGHYLWFLLAFGSKNVLRITLQARLLHLEPKYTSVRS